MIKTINDPLTTEHREWLDMLAYTERQLNHYGITKKEVAKRCNMSPSAISRIFNARMIPTVVNWIKINQGIQTLIGLRESVSHFKQMPYVKK